MNRQEWLEYIESTVTVAGAQKRVRDCTDDEIEIVREGLLEQIRHAQAELELLRERRRLLKDGFVEINPEP